MLGIHFEVGAIEALVQCAERLGGRGRMDLASVPREELEGIVKALLLAHEHRFLAHIHDALTGIQSVDDTPEKVEWHVELVVRARPGTIHLRTTEECQAQGSHEVRQEGARRPTLAVQVVPTAERTVLDPEAILERRRRPLPQLGLQCVALVLTLFLVVLGRQAVEQETDVQPRLWAEELRIQGEGLEAELVPGWTLDVQVEGRVRWLAFVGALVAGAARLDLDEGDAVPLRLGIAAKVLSHRLEKAMVVLLVFWGEVERIVRPLVPSTSFACLCDDLRDAGFVDPIGRFRTGLEGDVERNIISEGLLHQTIQLSPVEDPWLGLHSIPGRVAARASDKRKLPEILDRIASIPDPEAAG